MADNENTTPEITGPVNEGKTTPPLVTDAPTPAKKRGQKIVDEVKRVEGAIIEDAKKVGDLIKEEIKTLEDAVTGAAEDTAKTELKTLEDKAKAEVKTTVEDFIKEEVHKVVEEIQSKLPDIPTLQDILWKQHGVKVN